MTAEVAVMNAQAIALAADSAVTLDSSFRSSSGGRAFSTADKIFGITPRDPIAAMVYGSASFMGLPWETVLKAYRRSLGKLTLATVADYARDFATFLERNTALFPPDDRLRQVRKEVRSRLLRIRDFMELTLDQALQHKRSVSREWVERALAGSVRYFYELYEKASPVRGLTATEANKLVARHRDSILKIQEHVFQGLPISSACRWQLDQLHVWFLTRFPLQPVCHVGHHSGVVFAGFGAGEYFPVVAEMHLDGIVDNTLRHVLGKTNAISRLNPSAVIPFGQEDMVQTFMEGINPIVRDHHTRELREFSRGLIEILLAAAGGRRRRNVGKIRRVAEEALTKQLAALGKWRDREETKPSLYIIQSLPKEELATLAESLVSLTSLKRRVMMDSTVGGPIDVCVISKHDGCVWVKKKQYFPAEMNPGFFTRKQIAWEEISNATNQQTSRATNNVSLDRGDTDSLLPDPVD